MSIFCCAECKFKDAEIDRLEREVKALRDGSEFENLRRQYFSENNQLSAYVSELTQKVYELQKLNAQLVLDAFRNRV